jgi:predicted Zn-dependent peptidase
VSVSGLTKFLPQLLPVIKELVTDAVFPEEELAIFKQNSKQRLSVNLKKCDFVAGRLIDSYVYGPEHPYGCFYNAEDYDALNREDLISFYKQYYQHGNCIIFVSGKLPANIEELLNANFGTLPLTAWKPNTVSNVPNPSAQKKYRIENDKAGVQGAIRIAAPFPGRKHPDFIKVLFLNNLFGGFFGSRLMSNIREEKGYTYGIYSYLQNHLQDTAWLISTEAGKDVCEATVKEVYIEMQKLRDEAIDEEEISLVRNYMIGTILGDLDGPFQIMGRWKNIILNGLDADYFVKTIETVKTITAAELQALAKKYLQPEHFYELVVI